MKTRLLTTMAITGLILLAALLLFGCSKSTEVQPGAADPLTRSVDDIDGRIEQHDRVMWADSTIEGRRGEMQHYLDDLDEMFDHLGDTLAAWEQCSMTFGGHHMGGGGGGGDDDPRCPSAERMDDLYDEYHRHYEEMDSILHHYDTEGFAEEMNDHFENMHSYLDSMMWYFDDHHGTEMMHDHDHDQDDCQDDDHGYGHGHGG